MARSAVWRSATLFFSRVTRVRSSGPIIVTFLDQMVDKEEDGLDQGGLRREFFRLLSAALLTTSGLFIGKHRHICVPFFSLYMSAIPSA